MYRFNSKDHAGQSLVHVINLMLGDNIVGAEVGVYEACTTCTLVQNCPGIKKLFAIDSWKPFEDYIKDNYDRKPVIVFDDKRIEFAKLTALHNIKYSGVADRIQVIEKDSDIAALEIKNESLDFIFLDAHLTPEHLYHDLQTWYSKVRQGGIIAVHDTDATVVGEVVIKFLHKTGCKRFSTFADTMMWVKL